MRTEHPPLTQMRCVDRWKHGHAQHLVNDPEFPFLFVFFYFYLKPLTAFKNLGIWSFLVQNKKYLDLGIYAKNLLLVFVKLLLQHAILTVLTLSYICYPFCYYYFYPHWLLIFLLSLSPSGGRVGLRSVLVALPHGPLPAVPLPGRALSAAVRAFRVLQPAVCRALLSERGDKSDPLQHHVVEVPGCSSAPVRPDRRTAVQVPHGQHLEGRRLKRLDRIHCELLNPTELRSQPGSHHFCQRGDDLQRLAFIEWEHEPQKVKLLKLNYCKS